MTFMQHKVRILYVSMVSTIGSHPSGLFNAIFLDCSELFDRLRPPSGFYRIRPKSRQEPLLVYCDMEDGGGWTVFQKRRHGKVDFNRYLVKGSEACVGPCKGQHQITRCRR